MTLRSLFFCSFQHKRNHFFPLDLLTRSACISIAAEASKEATKNWELHTGEQRDADRMICDDTEDQTELYLKFLPLYQLTA